jgi:hypothetical protein
MRSSHTPLSPLESVCTHNMGAVRVQSVDEGLQFVNTFTMPNDEQIYFDGQLEHER